jgi:hypothetical protein
MRSIRRMVVALAACAILVGVFGASSASALTVKPCIGSGSLRVTPSGDPLHPYLWTIQGSGSCPANLTLLLNPNEAQTVRFFGQGTSDTLGLCDGSLLVQNLLIVVRVQYTNVVTGTTTTETQYWRAPLTTYPVATPYLMTTRPGAGAFGAGIALHHILLGCGNAGTMPSASFGWVELRR